MLSDTEKLQIEKDIREQYAMDEKQMEIFEEEMRVRQMLYNEKTEKHQHANFLFVLMLAFGISCAMTVTALGIFNHFLAGFFAIMCMTTTAAIMAKAVHRYDI